MVCIFSRVKAISRQCEVWESFHDVDFNYLSDGHTHEQVFLAEKLT